ncbi:tetratricopeptide repeat protein [Streptomyces chartreusis]|uniref:tetratricopeptide repeat protein n=1 Tax=Streptomyces chartreusis TaxID=1969 RepID=UPI0037FAAD66
MAVGRDILASALGPNSQVDNSRHYHLPAPRTETEWPVRVGVPPLPASAFQPRPALRAAIAAARTAGDTAVLTGRAGGFTQVLSGGGGVGKTQLAAAYAYEAALLPTDLILWIPAADTVQVITAYAQAAQRVQAPGADGDDPEHDARAFLSWLAVTNRSWLVVLDDITAPGALASWWPPSRPGTGWTLATTRLKDAVLTGQGRVRVDVDVYTSEEARGYLADRLTGDGCGHLLDGHEREVARELGHLPLALGHAAAYLINQQTTCNDYLARLRDGRNRIDRFLPEWADTEGYGHRVAAALLLSFDTAEAADTTGLARPLLQLAALLDPAGQPVTLWASPPVLRYLSSEAGRGHITADEIREALLVLHRYALITYDSNALHREVRIHALTARATREAYPIHLRGQRVDLLAEALTDLWPDLEHRERDLVAVVLRGNSEALTCHASGLHSDALMSLAAVYGASLEHSGLHSEAADHWGRFIQNVTQVAGSDDPAVHCARGRLAGLYHHFGQDRYALDLAKRALTDLERVVGPDHPLALVARINIIPRYSHCEENTEAVRLSEQVLAALGPDHRYTYIVEINLLSAYSGLGRHEEALRLGERVIAHCERTLGPDHPHTHAARLSLAFTYGLLGRYEEASQIQEAVLAYEERTLGPDHPSTLHTHNALALTYRSLQRHDEARRHQEHVLAVRERTLDPLHPDLLGIRLGLADTYRDLGREDDAARVSEGIERF